MGLAYSFHTHHFRLSFKGFNPVPDNKLACLGLSRERCRYGTIEASGIVQGDYITFPAIYLSTSTVPGTTCPRP